MTTHPHGERLSAYLDGMLDPWQMRQVAQHLADCAECRSHNLSLHEVTTALRRMPAPESPDADFWTDIYRHLRTEGGTRPVVETRFRRMLSLPMAGAPRRLAAAFAAVAFLGAALTGSVLLHTTPPRSALVVTGSADSVDLSSLVRAHTESAAHQPLADPDRQTMIAADADDGTRFADSAIEVPGDGESLAADAVH